MSNETILTICMCLLTLSILITVFCIAISTFKEFKTDKEAYDKGYNTAKNLYFGLWRKKFETARLKLIDHDDKWGDHYVTMYFKRKEL